MLSWVRALVWGVASCSCVEGAGLRSWLGVLLGGSDRPSREGPSYPQFAPVDSEAVASYFEQGDLDGLCWALRDHFARTSRMLGPLDGQLPLREALVAKGAGNTYSSAYKLDHDIEQLEYVASKNSTVARWSEAGPQQGASTGTFSALECFAAITKVSRNTHPPLERP